MSVVIRYSFFSRLWRKYILAKIQIILAKKVDSTLRDKINHDSGGTRSKGAEGGERREGELELGGWDAQFRSSVVVGATALCPILAKRYMFFERIILAKRSVCTNFHKRLPF